MRSFKVTRAAEEAELDIGDCTYVDIAELVCRSCEEGGDYAAFIPEAAGVGATLRCPYCGEESVVPKKARWS